MRDGKIGVSLIDSIRNSLESAWQARKSDGDNASEFPRIETLIEQHSESLTALSREEKYNLLIAVIQHEIELRRKSGEQLSAAEYASRFPDISLETFGELIALPSLPPPAPAGTELPIRYQMIEEIGRGGIGNVWRVRDTHMERPLAIKMLHQKFQSNPIASARLRREATLTGSLQHPGVPPVHDRGRTAGGAEYFAMKLVDGKTLGQILSEQHHPRPTTELESSTQLLGIFEQIAQTLAYAHTQGVIHRDLKPTNVMVGEFGEVQVMDWGLAKKMGDSEPPEVNAVPMFSAPADVQQAGVSMGDTIDNSVDSSLAGPARIPDGDGLTRIGDVFGTPAYMPPEQARGEIDSLGPQSDVYGLGAILFELLTGTRLFDEVQAGEVVASAAAGELGASLSRLDNSDADKQLVQLCRSCLEPKPENRPLDASVVAEQMGDYFAGVQSRLRRSEIAQAETETKADEAKKRRRLAQLLVSALMVSLVGGIAAVAWQWQATAAALEDSRIHLIEAKKQTAIAEKQTSVAEEQSELSLGTLTDVIRNYQEVFDAIKMESSLSEESNRAREKMLKTALNGMEKISTRLEKHPDYSANLLIAHMDLGSLYLSLGGENFEDARDKALEHYELANRIGERFVEECADESNETQFYASRLYAQTMEKLGHLAFLNDDSDTAIQWLNKGIGIAEGLWERRPTSKAIPQDLFHQHFSVSAAEFRRFHLTPALDHLQACLAVVERAKSNDVEIIEDYERDYVMPELLKRIEIFSNLPAVRLDPDAAFELPDDIAARVLYDCAAWHAFEGNHIAGFEVMQKLETMENLQPNHFYNNSCGYARCLKALADGREPTDFDDLEMELADKYASACVATLKKAQSSGFFDDSSNIALLGRDPDLESVSQVAEFKLFVAELRAGD